MAVPAVPSLLFLLTLLSHEVCHSYNVGFAARVAVQYFPTCSVITITTSGNPSDLQEVSDLDTSFITENRNDVPLSSRYLLGLETKSTIDGLRDLRTHTPYCRVIITFVQGQTFNASQFMDTVIPRERPISLRDVDHYIYLTGNKKSLDEERSLVHNILLSDISVHTRYKVVATSTTNRTDTRLYTFCLYCDHTVTDPRGRNAILAIFEDTNEAISKLFPDFTKNFHGHPMYVVGPTKYISLYEMERKNDSKWYEHKRGLFTEFFFIMRDKLNFSYFLKPCSGFGNIIPEGNTGTMLPNGTWGGCVADIYYGWADISLGGSPAGDRLHYVDFSTNMRYDYVQFFTHGPRIIYPWYTVFVAFDTYGWASVILSVLIGTLVLFKTEDFLETPGPSIWDVFFYLYAYLIGQDLSVEPRSISSKMTFVSWLYYGIVIGSAYACSLQSLIVSPGLSTVPHTMAELARARNWACGVPLSFRNGLGENIFKSSKNPDMKKLYRETQEDKNAVVCLKRAATQDYGCFHWQIMAEFYMGTLFVDKAGNHPFLYAKDYILFSGPTWMMRKREIWRDGFNDFFGRQFSMGIVYEASARDRRVVRRQLVQEVKEGKRKPLESYTDTDDGPKPFTFDNVKACFIVLILGLIVSSFSFVHEAFPKRLLSKLSLSCRYGLWRVLNCWKCGRIRN